MYKHILVATDGSELAGRALDHALRLGKTVGAAVTIVTVTEPSAVIAGGIATVGGTSFEPIAELLEAQEAEAKEVLKKATETAAAAGVAATTVHVDGTYPADGIISTANSVGADLIVMGSHGRTGFGRLLLGSQTNNVLSHTTVPVLVTR